LTDDRIDRPQTDGWLGVVFQMPAHEAVAAQVELHGQGAGGLQARRAILVGKPEHALDAAHGGNPVARMNGVADGTDVDTHGMSLGEQAQDAGRGAFGLIVAVNAVLAARLP
jgi:nitrogen fixation protein FixH